MLKQIRTRIQADEVRIPIQTASAVLLAYFSTSFMETEDVSWGVFSALFVVQASIGGTIEAAFGRIAGAILGALIAVGLVMSLGSSEWGTLVALLSGVAIMSFLTAKWPVLAYGLVTVTIIAVAPDFQVVEGAFKKIVAISIGSLCGIVAAFAVLPVRARRTEQQYLAAALRHCGACVIECSACAVRDKEEKDRSTQGAIQRAIERARIMAREARIEDKTPAMGLNPFPKPLLPQIERFAYTLTLVDRFSDNPISEVLCRDHREAMLDLGKKIAACLERISDAVEFATSCEGVGDAHDAYTAFCTRVDDAVQHGNLSWEDREHLVAIKRAYGAVISNLEALVRDVQGK